MESSGSPNGDTEDDDGYDEGILGDQNFMVADEEIAGAFGSGTLQGLREGRSRWAARFHGEGLDGPSADPLKTAALIRRVAITARWMANGLFPGSRGVPGFVLGAAAHSIVLEFTLAPDEEPVALPRMTDALEDDEEAAETEADSRTVYPTVEGGRYFATLLATAGDPDMLVERLGVVGRQAVATYQGALREFVEYGAEADFLVPVEVAEGQTDLRRVTMTTDQSESELEVLMRPPEQISHTFEVEGLLYTQNSLSNEFGIQRDNEQHVTGEFDMRVADKLGPAWNKRVWARIQEIGPSQDWMPRAGRVRRTLIDVATLREGETRL